MRNLVHSACSARFTRPSCAAGRRPAPARRPPTRIPRPPTAKPLGSRTAAMWERTTIVTDTTVAEKAPLHVTTTVKERFHVDPDKYLDHGSVVIAAITSCTNTSNPSVMIAAGLLAKKAVEKGLTVPPWVKTSLAPGSRVVTDYYEKSGLLPYLEKLRFNVVGYGCTTCIGNSGPLPTDVSKSIEDHGLVAVSVLSGNRNFEGRVNVDVRANYLMSPPLVVAYALAGRIGHNFDTEPLGKDKAGQPVYLKDLWPTQQEVAEAIEKGLSSEGFRKEYSTVSQGDANWQGLSFPTGDVVGARPPARRSPWTAGARKRRGRAGPARFRQRRHRRRCAYHCPHRTALGARCRR